MSSSTKRKSAQLESKDTWLQDALALSRSDKKLKRAAATRQQEDAASEKKKRATQKQPTKKKAGGRPLRSASLVQAPPHKYSSPRPAALALTEKKKKKRGVNSRRKKQQKRTNNGLVTLVIDGEEVIRDLASHRAAEKAAARAAAAAEAGDDASQAAAPPAKRTLMGRAFELASLQERLDAEVQRMTQLNTAALDAALEQANADAVESTNAAEAEPVTQEQEGEDGEHADAATESQAAATSRHGRVRRKAQEAGTSLANYWGGSTMTQKKSVLSWRSEEYKRLNREKYSQFDPPKSTQEQNSQEEPNASAAAASSSAEPAAAAASAASSSPTPTPILNAPSKFGVSYGIDRHYTSSSLDPLKPDREANEIFQIEPELRLAWKDPTTRLRMKIENMPTTEFDRFEGFALPFDQFGDAMQKRQKKDVPPKFKVLTQNKLKIDRGFFNACMGLKPKKSKKSATSAKSNRGDDDDGVNEKCQCLARDPEKAPKPGSKQALLESQQGKSYNCGEDCHNSLLMVECTPENCNLTSLGKEEQCQNRKFANQGGFEGVEPFKTEFKGWGVRCPTSDIPAHTFIYEYVGEIINNAMCQSRMAAENERIRKLNQVEMKKRAEIRKKEYKKRMVLEEKFKEQENMILKNNPNAEEGKPMNRYAKEREMLRRHSTQKPKYLEESALASAQTKARKSAVEYSNASLDDDEAEPTEYMEGEGPKSSNFYFLTIADDIIIDAGAQGGIARFTNHSCNPNCSIQKWNVNGSIRIGIFSNQLIPRGKELTIDYKYDRVGNVHRQACFCGEPNCAKFIGGKKKEIIDASGRDNNKRNGRGSKKAKEVTQLDQEDADEVCPVCGDGGDMLMCDSRVCGNFCTRCYHPKCVSLTADTIPNKWICPYHFCDECGSVQVRYFCNTCSQSACERCWNASREPDAAETARAAGVAKNEEPSALHQSKVRRDLPNYRRNVWICCDECQIDPMCLRERERQAFYEEQAAVITTAISERLSSDRDFGVGLSSNELYETMCRDPSFEPRFRFTYWHVSQKKRGVWSDGWIAPSMTGVQDENEISDEEFLRREKEERESKEEAEGKEDEEEANEEQESKEQEDMEEKKGEEPAPAAAASSSNDDVAPMDMSSDNEDSSSHEHHHHEHEPQPQSKSKSRKSSSKTKSKQKRASLKNKKKGQPNDEQDEEELTVRVALKNQNKTPAVEPIAAAAAPSSSSVAPSASQPSKKRSRKVRDLDQQNDDLPTLVAVTASPPSFSVIDTKKVSAVKQPPTKKSRTVAPAAAASSSSKPSSSSKLSSSSSLSSKKLSSRPQQQIPSRSPSSASVASSSSSVVIVKSSLAQSVASSVASSRKRKKQDKVDRSSPTDTESSGPLPDEDDEQMNASIATPTTAASAASSSKRPKRASATPGPIDALNLTQEERQRLIHAFGAINPRPISTGDEDGYLARVAKKLPKKFAQWIRPTYDQIMLQLAQ